MLSGTNKTGQSKLWAHSGQYYHQQRSIVKAKSVNQQGNCM